MASLLGKAVTYGADTHARPEPEGQRRVLEFLTRHGWLLGGSAELASGDGGSELHFRAPGCTGVVRVGLLAPNGEMVSLFVRSAGRNARVFYTYRGRTAANPPRFAYLHAKFARVMEAAGLGSGPNPPIVAVSEPEACRLEATLPWSEL